jgi:hypothetical protein
MIWIPIWMQELTDAKSQKIDVVGGRGGSAG